MKNKKVVFIAVFVIILVVGGFLFMKERAQKARYAAKREFDNQVGVICGGTGAANAAAYTASGQHPIIFATEGYDGNYLPAYNTPLAWKANSLEEMQLVACITERNAEIEQCSYEISGSKDSAVLIRTQSKALVTLREAQTGAVVATSDELTGGLPRECQDSEQFQDGESTQYVTGTSPDDLINEWLKPFVETP